MSNQPNYKSFIFFSNNTKGSSTGKKVFIDPNLIIPFVEAVEPFTPKGRITVQMIEPYLTATPSGQHSGSAQNQANRFFKDFGIEDRLGVRLYFDVLQDNAADNSSLGAGVYIYDLKKHFKGAGEKPGLYYAEYVNHSRWESKWCSKQVITEKKVVIGAEHDEGVYSTDATNGLVEDHFPNDKTTYNLFYCPDFVVDNGLSWVVPENRSSLPNGPSELAKMLIDSTNTWVATITKLEIHVFGTGAKTLLAALDIVKSQNITLDEHTFTFYSPHASIPSILTKVNNVKGTVSNKSFKTMSPISMLHQQKDASNLMQLKPGPASQMVFDNLKKAQHHIESKTKTFMELCSEYNPKQ